jgi:hypothetical protein
MSELTAKLTALRQSDKANLAFSPLTHFVSDIFPTEINDLLCDELLMDQHASLQGIQRVGHKRSGKYIPKLRFLQDLTGL